MNELHTQLQAQDEQAMAGFQKVGRHIEQHQLADIIKERHQNAVESYRKDMDILLNNVQTAITAKDAKAQFEAVMAARKHLEGKQLERSQQPFDPNNLPHKSMQPNPDNKPKLTAQEFADAGLVNTPLTQYASHGSYNFGNLAGASNPAYLAETDEVKITPAIQAKADELQHDPVLIYNWVRNNIEWIPSWGAMQDSDITLGSKRGNAMDIASLLIALYRASGIPSRYVHGTIELPADKFRNWAGGFESTEAAADFAASGGIPTGIGIEGGIATVVQLEHIWVEAAIDYQPSRGAINRDADSWVSLDASFKQYEFLAGLDVEAITGIDPVLVATDFANSGIVNESEGSATNLDVSILQNSQQQAIAALENHIATNLPNARVGDVIGGRRILDVSTTTLPSSLPNFIQVLGVRYAEIPSSLQSKITFQLGVDEIRQPVGVITLSFAQVNNHKVTLSFRPETEADRIALESFVPVGSDVSNLPGSLPSYLARVTTELKINDILVASGQTLSLGEEMAFRTTISNPGHGASSSESLVYAGSYLSVATIGGSVSATKLTDTHQKFSQAKTIISVNDPAALSSVTRENYMGEMFHFGMLKYFGQFREMVKMVANSSRTIQGLLPSTGTYGYVPTVDYFFGLPRNVQSGGIQMDLTNIATFTGAKQGDNEIRKDLVLKSGIISSILEHAVTEELFANGGIVDQAASAVKALQVANAEGQTIYQISSENLAAVLPNLTHDSATLSEISVAVTSGQLVITHQNSVNISGWVGFGYIILDQETGSGAYKISGGANGSYFVGLFLGLMLVALFVLAVASTGGLALVGAAVLGSVGLSGFLLTLLTMGANDQVDVPCFLNGLLWGATLGFLAFLGVPQVVGVGGLVTALGMADGMTGTLPGIECWE